MAEKAYIKVTFHCPECDAELSKLPSDAIQVNCKGCGAPVIISEVNSIKEALRILYTKSIVPFVGGKQN